MRKPLQSPQQTIDKIKKFVLILLYAMDSNQIIYIEKTLRLTSQDLAKALAVAPITVARWEQGLNVPTGLQSEVLQGLYNLALEVDRDEDGKRADMINGLLLLGIGALIFYLLSRGR